MSDDPMTPWRDEGGPLGDAIREAQQMAPSADQLQHLAASLGPILGPPPAGPGAPLPTEAAGQGAGATGSATTGASTATVFPLKWAIAAAVMLAVPATWWWSQQTSVAPTATTVPAAETPDATETPRDMPVVETVTPNTNGGGVVAGDPNPIGPSQPHPPAALIPTVSATGPEAPLTVAELPTPAATPTRVRRATAHSNGRIRERNATNAPEASGRTPSDSSPSRDVSSDNPPQNPPDAVGGGATSAEIATSSSDPPRESPPEALRPPSELVLLEDARRRLRAAPADALQAANRHRELYPRGTLAEEREVLAIDALVRLGRTSGAERRASRFQVTYPRSVHHARIQALLSPQ